MLSGFDKTANTLTIRVRVSPSLGPLLPAEAMSLLMGVPVEEMRAHGRSVSNGVMTLPPEWVRAGRQRAREAQAHTGIDDMVSCLQYWALKDHSARLEIVYEDLPAGGTQ
jgi:hypothetical protein